MAGRSPVIVVTGTPGTGKSTHAQLLVQESPIPLQHINVGELVKTHGLHEGFDEEWQSFTVDEDKVSSGPFGWVLCFFLLSLFPSPGADQTVLLFSRVITAPGPTRTTRI